MNRDEKLNNIVGNYIQKRDQRSEISIMNFHREHLLMFLHRLQGFASNFSTSRSALLSHDMFLMVEAVTTVARADWIGGKGDEKECRGFAEYFDAYDKMVSGSVPLDQAASMCIELLTVSQ